MPPFSFRNGHSRRLLLPALLLPVAIYAGLAAAWIGAGVGYQMDEGLYVESAVFVLRGGSTPGAPVLRDWVAAHGRRWPLMIAPYVGTAKAFAALPLFALFGVTPAVARISGVLLGALGIGGLAALLAVRVRPAAGLLAGGLLAIHASYLDFTVFDNGGVSVWMGAMGLMALALAFYGSRSSGIPAFLLGACAGLAVWARANLVWLIAAGCAGALVAFGRRAIPRKSRLLALAAGGICGALPLWVYEAGSGLGTWRFFVGARHPWTAARSVERLRALARTLIADGEQRAIWSGPPPTAWEWGAGAGLLVLVAAALLIPTGPGDGDRGRWRRALAAAAAALAFLLVSSRLTVSEHHLVAVLPLAAAALAVFLVEARERRARGTAALAAVLASWALLSLVADVRVASGLARTRGRSFWSSAIDDAGASLRSHPVPVSRLKIVSWGLQKNLYVSSSGAVYGTEIYRDASLEKSARGLSWDEEIREGGTFLLLAFPAGDASLDLAAEGFQRALRARSGPSEEAGPIRERIFRDTSGNPIVRMLQIPAAATSSSSRPSSWEPSRRPCALRTARSRSPASGSSLSCRSGRT